MGLYYEWCGSRRPGDRAVLLLHGLGSSSRDWRFQVPAFEPWHRLLLVDLPGHGATARPARGVTVTSMARAVEGLLAAVEEVPLHVVGLSLGGCVALELALNAPGRVRSLTLVNSFARLPRPSGPHARRLLVRALLLGTAPMSLVAAHVARGLFPHAHQDDLRRMAAASLQRTSRRAYVAGALALVRFDARARLGAVRGPALVVTGADDQTVPPPVQAALAGGIPGARHEVVPDSGHLTPADQPTVFNRLVLEFLAAH